jgi:hypothetical protein
MLCERCKEREAAVYLVLPREKKPPVEGQHLCQPCFENRFHNGPEILEKLRKAQADAKSNAGVSCGWTSYTPEIKSGEA